MKKVKFLMIQYGEFVHTPRDILEPYVGQEYDTEAMAGTIRSNDDWRLEPKKLYAIEEIEIPSWMKPKEYNSHNWTWYKRIGGTEDLGRKTFKKIISIQDGTLRLACMKLLNTKNFRSEFRKSLHSQLIKWIGEHESEYNNPFSPKQISLLCNEYTYLEAKQLGVAA